MATFSCFFTTFLVNTSPPTPVIYSLKFLDINILGIDFLTSRSGPHCENQLALGSSVR